MDFFAELADKQRVSLALKRSIPIGIFGSFNPRNKPLLEAIRDRLRAAGYDACISRDLEKEHPKGEEEDVNAYNLRISHLLLDRSHIHIFVFFYEKDTEHNINQSASMEYDRLCERGGLHDGLILGEEGMLEQAGGILLGRLSQNRQKFRWEPFIRTEDNTVVDAVELEILIQQFCLNRILYRTLDSAAGKEGR